MLTVSLVNARFFAFHGWHEEERKCGNWFEVDVDVQFSIPDSVEALDGTLDYAILYGFVKARMEDSTKLLETIAERILNDVLKVASDARINIVLRKENPPLGGQVQYSQISLRNY